jgi:hypothetical protein
MGLFHGLARLLEVGGALSRGPRSDRLELPRDAAGRARWNRDDVGLYQWSGSGMARRGALENGAGHEFKRASGRSAA